MSGDVRLGRSAVSNPLSAVSHCKQAVCEGVGVPEIRHQLIIPAYPQGFKHLVLLTKGARTLDSLWHVVNRLERAEYEHVAADDDPHVPAKSETVLKPFINSGFCEREDMGHWVFSTPPAQRPVRELLVNKSHPNTAYLISYSREQLFRLPLQVMQNFSVGATGPFAIGYICHRGLGNLK